MKKVFTVFLCFIVIFSFLAINCFAYNVSFNDDVDYEYFLPRHVDLGSLSLSFNDTILSSLTDYSITNYDDGVGGCSIYGGTSGNTYMTTIQSEGFTSSVYVDFGHFTFYEDDPLPSPLRTVTLITNQTNSLVDYSFLVSIDYYNYYSGTRGYASHTIDGTVYNGEDISINLDSLKDLILPSYRNPVFSITLSIVSESTDIDSLQIVSPELSVHRDLYYILPDDIAITQQVVNPNIVEWLVTSLNSFFEVQIFGDITIGNIFGIALAVPLVIWFLKLFAGG